MQLLRPKAFDPDQDQGCHGDRGALFHTGWRVSEFDECGACSLALWMQCGEIIAKRADHHAAGFVDRLGFRMALDFQTVSFLR